MWSTLSTSSRKKTSSRAVPIKTKAIMRYAIGPTSSFGHVFVGLIDNKIRLIALGSTSSDLLSQVKLDHPSYNFVAAPAITPTLREVIDYIEDPTLSLPNSKLDNAGTAFQHRVWKAISAIPLGSTCTYAQLAEDIGQPNAVRAVAQACGRNGLAVIVPCHRVVGSDGGLGGYRWGVERKRALLEREKAVGLKQPRADVESVGKAK